MFEQIRRIFSAEPELTVRRETRRNDPCPCGSRRKYKQCCMPQERR